MTTSTFETGVDQKRAGLYVPGLSVILAGAVQGDGALLSSAYRGQSPVSEDQLSFPWSGATAVTTSLVWGITQIMLVLGLVAFARSGIAGGRAGTRGAWLTVLGATLYVPAHALSIVFRDRDLDESAGIVVVSLFGVGTVLMAIGLVVAGSATLRSGVWADWRRMTPIALGIWMIAMIPLQFTPLLPVAVGVYAVAVVAFGIALAAGGGRESAE